MTPALGRRGLGRAAAAVLCAGGVAGLAGLSAPPAGASVHGNSWAATATKALPLRGARALGATNPRKMITVRAVLELRDRAALERRLATNAAPLSRSQFEARFAPTPQEVATVRGYLAREGFRQLSVTGNRLLVSATGSVGDVERAFHTSLRTFRLAGKVVFANTSGAFVPARLSKTVGAVLGLNDIVALHSTLRSTRNTKPSLTASSGVPQYDVSYQPNQFAGIYGATAATPNGHKTSIAIITEGNLTQVVKDLRIEEKINHLPQVPVSIVHAGVASPDTSAADEWDMDTQTSTGMAWDVKRLYLYDATSLTDSDLALAINKFVSQDVAQGGSASLGECETFPYLDGSMFADDEAFAEGAVQGQSFFASSGDTGAACAVAPTNGVPDSGLPNVNYPASSPYVTAVGGTTLLTNSNNSYYNEIAWNAGGGGTSIWETAPYWQNGVVPGSTAGKGVPDIAMDADPYSGVTLVMDGTESPGWGGTSLSSPLALGVWARLETGHNNRLGMASIALYKTYGAGSCTSLSLADICSTPAFHDITLGTNGGFVATPGWDYTTGLGSFDIAPMERLIK